MKKLATLLLAAGLVFGAATGASAIDFKAKGQWVMSFDYGQGMSFMEKNRNGKKTAGSGYAGLPDSFEASQRIRLQLDAVASEALSGTVYFEIGNQIWGKAEQGSALGTDGTVVEVRRAYLDWIVPQTDLKLRMGLQGVALPAFTNNASQVFDADVAAVVASYKFNENVAATFFWARPFNDNYAGSTATDGSKTGAANLFDNVDMLALLVPLTFDGVKVTPWVSYAMFGKNYNGSGSTSLSNGQTNGGNNYYKNFTAPGMTPAVYVDKGKKADVYGSAFWGGLTGEITMADPFRFAWDANYGSYTNGIEAMKREGWYISMLGEYKMDWATPGLYAWYASGDDSNIKNGSERMPSVAADGTDGFSNFASTGQPYIGRENILSSQWTGTWGIGARLKDMSFLEDLKHTFRINYISGTNSPTMAKYITGKKDKGTEKITNNYSDFNEASYKPNPVYLTTQDSALEFGLTTTYKVYENLTLFADLEYMAMFLDKSSSVWGKGDTKNGYLGSFQSTDPWNINVSFVYDF